MFNDIIETKYERGFSYIKVIIKIKTSIITLKTFDNKASVIKFLQSITEQDWTNYTVKPF